MRRERPTLRTPLLAPPAREAIDVTPAPLMPPALALPAAGSASVDLGAGGADGIGEGAGSGTGIGDGRGRGGTGAVDVYARAEWVEQPPQSAYRRFWPIGRPLPKYAVTVRVICHVRRNGSPYRCRHMSEQPRGAGFSKMIQRVVVEGKVRPLSRNGAPLWDRPVIIEVVLDLMMAAPRVSAAASALPSPARP